MYYTKNYKKIILSIFSRILMELHTRGLVEAYSFNDAHSKASQFLRGFNITTISKVTTSTGLSLISERILWKI